MGNTFYFQWEPELMAWIQSFMGDALTAAATFFTMFGETMVLILIMGFFYWCYDKKLGIYVGMNLIMVSVWNSMIKNVFVRRRPYFDNPRVECLKKVDSGADAYDIAAQGYSFPSGHSSGSAAIYGSIGAYVKKRWTTILAILLPVLVGISRVCLGVHYPTDVLCGWGLGIVTILLASFLQRKIQKKWVLYLLFTLTAIPGCFYCTTHDYFTSFGMMIGFFLGNLFEERFVNFQNTRSVPKIFLRLAGGLGVYLGLNTLLKLPFSDAFLSQETAAAYGIRAGRYAIILFVVVAIYPMIFDKFGQKKK